MKWILILFALMLFFQPGHSIVDMKNANYADTWIDLIVPGSGYDLRVRRTVNSRSLFNGIFGFGWCSDFETSLKPSAEGNLLLTECGGGLEIVFSPKDFNHATTQKVVSEILKNYQAQNSKTSASLLQRIKENLEQNDDYRRKMALKFKAALPLPKDNKVFYARGKEVEHVVHKGTYYQRNLSDGTSQRFNLNGQLTHMYDKNGNYLLLKHNNGLLVNVTDNNGRKLEFEYYPFKKVKKITGPNGMSAEYKFGKNMEDLVWHKNQKGDIYSYEYDELHNITKIIYPDKTFKQLTYNKKRDWVTSFRDRDGCLEKYEYGDSKDDPKNHYWSLVTKTCGKKVVNKSRYEFWHKTRKDGKKYLSRVLTDNNGDVTDITYHEIFGRPISLRRNKLVTKFQYYENGLIKTKSTNKNIMTFKYDNPHKKVSWVQSVDYNDKKKPIKTVTTQFNYDQKGNLQQAKNSLGQHVSLSYDGKGRIAVIKDQAKKIVKISYEERFGKPSFVSRPGVGSINVAYNADGSIREVKSKEGPTVAIQVASTFNNLLDIIAPATPELRL